jgi:hypothetical protein
MAIVINGTGTITGLSVGGLPDGTVTGADLASGAALSNIGSGGVTQTYFATGVAGTGPAFSAYMSGNQTVTSGVITKLTLNTEVFDTASCFDSSTNYRFTPTVGGYYQINMLVVGNGSSTAVVAAIYKNGSLYTQSVFSQSAGVTAYYPLAALLYFNGSTDYVEFYAQTNGGSVITGGSTATFASASLARSA